MRRRQRSVRHASVSGQPGEGADFDSSPQDASSHVPDTQEAVPGQRRESVSGQRQGADSLGSLARLESQPREKSLHQRSPRHDQAPHAVLGQPHQQTVARLKPHRERPVAVPVAGGQGLVGAQLERLVEDLNAAAAPQKAPRGQDELGAQVQTPSCRGQSADGRQRRVTVGGVGQRLEERGAPLGQEPQPEHDLVPREEAEPALLRAVLEVPAHQRAEVV